MNTYLILLRGINVGGKSKLSMAELKVCLEEMGYTNILTYINSGNVILDAKESSVKVQEDIEAVLPKKFGVDSKILVLSEKELQQVVFSAPPGFGMEPDKYHCDVIFMVGKPTGELMSIVKTNPEVDTVWEGTRAVYFQRLSAKRTQSRMSRIIGTPIYKFTTIRNWNTTTKLLKLLKEHKNA